MADVQLGQCYACRQFTGLDEAGRIVEHISMNPSAFCLPCVGAGSHPVDYPEGWGPVFDRLLASLPAAPLWGSRD